MSKTAFCGLLLFALMPVVASAATATPPKPKVVFVGDYITAQWASAFAANPNWINQGNPEPIWQYSNESVNMANVIGLHPTAIHILIGLSASANVEDATQQESVPGFLNHVNSLVEQAKAANIQVILGLEPAPPNIVASFLPQMNAAIATYGAKYGIPVINYADVLCNCVSSLGGASTSQFFQENPAAFPATPVVPWDDDGTVTVAGYSLMTNLAESVVNTTNLKLESGWLSNLEAPSESTGDMGPVSNVNTVTTPAVVQFTPVGYYSDGSQHPMLNTSFQGASGTWASSNPLVMYVNQKGLAWAISAGTASITYTAPNGVQFSRWVMYIGTSGEDGTVPPCCSTD
jgi:hypothetical protein